MITDKEVLEQFEQAKHEATEISNKLLKVVEGRDAMISVISFEITRRALMQVLGTSKEQEKRLKKVCDIIQEKMSLEVRGNKI